MAENIHSETTFSFTFPMPENFQREPRPLSFSIYNFRISLIDKLVSENYNVILVAPIDEYTDPLKSRNIKFINWHLNRRSINPINELLSILNLMISRVKPRP